MGLALSREQREGLELLQRMTPEQRDALLALCQNEDPRLDFEVLADAISERVGVPSDDLQEAFNTMASVYGYARREAVPLAAAVADVVAAFEREADETGDVEGLASFLTGVLDANSGFGLAAKALSLTWDHSELFQEARILTDLRPVFDEHTGANPGSIVAHALTHTLRLTYVSREREMLESRFLVMTTKDLHDLARCIDRALSKDQTIREHDRSTTVIS